MSVKTSQDQSEIKVMKRNKTYCLTLVIHSLPISMLKCLAQSDYAVFVCQTQWRLLHCTHIMKLMKIVLVNIVMAGKE